MVKNLQQVPIQTPIIEPQSTKTPTPHPPPPPVHHHHHKPSNELRKPVTPDHLKLPKAFKYPERYHLEFDSML